MRNRPLSAKIETGDFRECDLEFLFQPVVDAFAGAAKATPALGVRLA